ncbi:hypothetical protein [Actinomadura macra]|uniref:hypothetical protein n=1 Tax=Actinomadura macra TaxID=46164 RepID=UPI000B338BF1|nr:hypothetical protein [Actinomadura macra]
MSRNDELGIPCVVDRTVVDGHSDPVPGEIALKEDRVQVHRDRELDIRAWLVIG